MNGRSPLLRAALSVALAAFVSNPALALTLGLRQASVLYVADNVHNGVYLFNAQNLSAPMLDAITTGVDQPTSIAVDSKGELYVANAATGRVTVYKQGTHAPYRTIAATKLGTPAALAVGSDNGLIVGYNGAAGQSATLAFFNSGSSRPSRLVSIPLGKNASAAIGAMAAESSSLYVSVTRSPSGPSQILRFARGSSNGIDIGIAPGTGEAFDAQGNFYVDGGASLAVYSPSRQTRYIIYGLVNAGQTAVAPDGTLFVPNGQHKICTFEEAGYVTEYAPGSQNANSYLTSSYLQNPVSVALLLVK
jgi:hypothetical protein